MSCDALVFFFCLLLMSFRLARTQNDICGNLNGRRIFVDLGKTEELSGNTALHDGMVNETVIELDKFAQCRIEFVSCPSCKIMLKFSYVNFPIACNGRPSMMNSCACDYVWIYEPPFRISNGEKFCNHVSSHKTYFSKTRTVVVNFYFKQHYRYTFSLLSTAQKNINVISGHPTPAPRSHNVISTPFFPQMYPKDLVAEHQLRCNETFQPCRIRLTFSDFLIGKVSVIEIIDEERRIEVTNGFTFRPPIVVTSGPFLNIRFYANGAADKGFRANFEFLPRTNKALQDSYKTNCGGLVSNFGGGITMMNMAQRDSVQSYDCIWIVQPSRNFLHFYTNVQLQLVEFSDFEPGSELVIREGSTSSGEPLESLRHPIDNLSSRRQAKQHSVPISEGYYVRFRGKFKPESRLAISYSAYNFFKCITGSDFTCDNQRCVPLYLLCDGFDHCGDASDEPSTCYQELKNRRWFHTLNFFFPNADKYVDIQAIAIVFVICTLGLICLILALMILIFRINRRSQRQQSLQQDHLQVISDLLDQDVMSTQEEILDEDEPPVYEAPPNYDDIRLLKKPKKRPNCNDPPRCFQCGSVRPGPTTCAPKKKSTTNLTENSNSSENNSTTLTVPSSPPPMYADLQVPESEGETASVVEPSSNSSNQQQQQQDDPSTSTNSEPYRYNFLRFSNEEFIAIKIKLLQKFQRNDGSTAEENVAVESELKQSPWLSDSNIVENGSVGANEVRFCGYAPKKLHRSFSFEL